MQWDGMGRARCGYARCPKPSFFLCPSLQPFRGGDVMWCDVMCYDVMMSVAWRDVGLILQLHRILAVPRKMTPMIDPCLT